ncbi:MAG TPA: hypothetical protein P5317_08070, partial [Myxococcota bacterium]|nr:hypothetical protein [Myxococcota bacterium]
CGNGEIDEGEQCDGANLNEQTCETQGFDGGTLSCTAACQFDTSGCADAPADCGNGEIDEGEQCDGANLNEQTCETQGFDGGTLSCTAACQFDTTGCTKIGPDCGNGEIDEGEQCDGANLNSQSCETQGFDGGTLSCTAACQFDTTGCTTIEKAGVGEPCTRNIECESDFCLTEKAQGFPSGYCAAPCNEDGTCDDANAICVDVGEYLCLRSCAPGGSDCRDAYKCVGLGEGAGACWPACTEDSQCTTTGDCNNQGFCETQCTDDADCQAGMACGLEGVCEPIDHCVTQGCNDPEGSLYCHEASGYCYDDACLDNPCDSLANASGVCERQYDDYRCGCVDEYVWDRAAGACIASECNAIDLGTFEGTRIEQTGDTCNGTSIYDAGGSGVTNCTGYPSWDKELVYKLTVPAGEAVEVHMEPTGFDASLWVTTSCDDFLGLECVVGADDPETVLIYNDTTEDQTYYIIADAYRNCGEFTLSVSKPPHCGNGIVDGDDQCDGDDFDEQTCAGLGYVGGGTLGCTQDCKFDTSGCIFDCQAVKLGTFSSSITRDNQDTCASTSLYNARGAGTGCTDYPTNGNEIVYELVVPAGQGGIVAVEPTGFDAAIWVTTSCDDLLGTQCIVGVDKKGHDGREELDLVNDGDSPQTYYIVVDAYSRCGTFNLTISSLGECGNGVKEDREQCDGSDFGGASCSNFGFVEGTLSCSAECELDFTNCNYGSLLLVGDPCTTDADCASGICWDELNKGLPGGYCVDKCTEEYGCWDPANICVSYLGDSFCAKKCTPGVSGECRDAYECLDLGGGNGACWAKCTTDSQCSVAGRCDLDSGLCTCLLGQHLDSDAGACVYDDCEYLGCANLNLNCDPAGGCSGACAVCTDCVSGTELSSSGRCVRIGAAWGGPCEVDADCPGSGTPGEDTFCNKSGTGGFCMQLGAPDYVGDGQPCTGDPYSVGVKVVYGSYLVSVCLQGCDTNADCRAGYTCSTDMDYNHSVLACSPIKECDTDGCNDDGSLSCTSDGRCWLDGCDPNPCTAMPNSTERCFNVRDSHVCECGSAFSWDDDSMSCVSFHCSAQDLGTVDQQIQLTGEDSCTGTNEYDAAGTGVSCTKYSTMGNEKLYRITLPARVSALIRMEPSGFDASLWVTTRCNDFNGLKCVKGADDDVGTPEVVTITNMSSRPATYYIVADAYSGCGTFNLTITPK